MGNGLPRKHNWWLVGISSFTTILFSVQALFAYQALTIRRDNYYLVSLIVFAGLTIFSLFAVIQGWRNALPGQRQAEDEAAAEEPPLQEH
jgi:hypothetical protein